MQNFEPPPGFRERETHAGFHELIGPFYICDDSSGRHYGFYVDARHINPAGVVHGGLLMTVMDMVLTSTVIHHINDKNHVSTVAMNCDFLKPVAQNKWITGRGEVTRRTRSLAFVRGQLRVGEDDAVTATGVWRIFSSPPRSSG